MHPELLRIGSFVLPTYGVLLAAGFLAALQLLRHRVPRFGITPDAASDVALWLLIGGLVGAKLLLVIVEWPRYVTSLGALMELARSAGVFYGGLLGAIVTLVVLIRKHRIPIFDFLDAASPCVALGQAIGRLGCLSAGCCWGRECHLPWAITFTDPAAEQNVGVPLHVPLHPTQLYEAIGLTIFLALLLRFEKNRFSGQTFGWYLVGAAVLRGAVEIFRGDPRGSVADVLSTSQFIAIGMLAAGIGVLVLRRRHVPVPA